MTTHSHDELIPVQMDYAKINYLCHLNELTVLGLGKQIGVSQPYLSTCIARGWGPRWMADRIMEFFHIKERDLLNDEEYILS